MEPPRKNGNVIFFVVVGAAIIWIVYQLNGLAFLNLVSPVVADALNAEGVIVSVESSASGKEAVVQLPDGEKVRANVPAQCVVFPGQIARLLVTDGSVLGKNRYNVLSAREPQ